jgi:large subunit ribosomal protein L1
MAKKPEDAAQKGTEEAPGAAPEGKAAETAKKKEPKAKPPRPPKAEGKEGKEPKEARAKPDTAEAAPAAEKAAPAAEKKTSPAPSESSSKKQRHGPPPRVGKRLRELRENFRKRLGKEGSLSLKRAVALLKEIHQQRYAIKKKEGKKKAGFDETVEIHMSLGIDATQSDQMVRGSVPLPHGVGKSVRVIVFSQGDNVAKAKEAGANEAGSDELIKRIQGGWLDFDVALATQDMMGQVSRLGKVLGPRGLMPTPKAGTVITAGSDVAAAVREFKAGKVEYRSDKSGNVHAGVGKMSFDDDKLVDNVSAFVEQVKVAKPSGIKGNYVRSITLSSTMSPGIPVLI